MSAMNSAALATTYQSQSLRSPRASLLSAPTATASSKRSSIVSDDFHSCLSTDPRELAAAFPSLFPQQLQTLAQRGQLPRPSTPVPPAAQRPHLSLNGSPQRTSLGVAAADRFQSERQSQDSRTDSERNFFSLPDAAGAPSAPYTRLPRPVQRPLLLRALFASSRDLLACLVFLLCSSLACLLLPVVFTIRAVARRLCVCDCCLGSLDSRSAHVPASNSPAPSPKLLRESPGAPDNVEPVASTECRERQKGDGMQQRVVSARTKKKASVFRRLLRAILRPRLSIPAPIEALWLVELAHSVSAHSGSAQVALHCRVLVEKLVDYCKLRALVESRLLHERRGMRSCNKFSRKVALHRLLGPIWVPDRSFSLSNHLLFSESKLRPGAELDSFVAEETRRSLDVDRPLWRIASTFVSAQTEQTLLLVTVHPAVGDALAVAQWLCSSLNERVNTEATSGASSPHSLVLGDHTNARLTAFTLSAAVASLIRTPLHLLTHWLRRPPADRNILHGAGRPVRENLELHFANIPMPHLLRVKHLLHASVAESLVAISAGALRAYEQFYEVDNPFDLNAQLLVPLNWRSRGAFSGDQKSSRSRSSSQEERPQRHATHCHADVYAVRVPLPTNTHGTIPRVWEAQQRSQRLDEHFPLLRNALSYLHALLPASLFARLAAGRLSGCSATIAVQRLPDAFLLLLGHDLREMDVWSTPTAGAPLSLSFLLYAGSVRLTLCADKRTCPNAELILRAILNQVQILNGLLEHKKLFGEYEEDEMPSGSESQEGSGPRRPTRRQAAWARAGELFSRLETASGGSIAGHEAVERLLSLQQAMRVLRAQQADSDAAPQAPSRPHTSDGSRVPSPAPIPQLLPEALYGSFSNPLRPKSNTASAMDALSPMTTFPDGHSGNGNGPLQILTSPDGQNQPTARWPAFLEPAGRLDDLQTAERVRRLQVEFQATLRAARATSVDRELLERIEREAIAQGLLVPEEGSAGDQQSAPIRIQINKPPESPLAGHSNYETPQRQLTEVWIHREPDTFTPRSSPALKRLDLLVNRSSRAQAAECPVATEQQVSTPSTGLASLILSSSRSPPVSPLVRHDPNPNSMLESPHESGRPQSFVSAQTDPNWWADRPLSFVSASSDLYSDRPQSFVSATSDPELAAGGRANATATPPTPPLSEIAYRSPVLQSPEFRPADREPGASSQSSGGGSLESSQLYMNMRLSDSTARDYVSPIVEAGSELSTGTANSLLNSPRAEPFQPAPPLPVDTRVISTEGLRREQSAQARCTGTGNAVEAPVDRHSYSSAQQSENAPGAETDLKLQCICAQVALPEEQLTRNVPRPLNAYATQNGGGFFSERTSVSSLREAAARAASNRTRALILRRCSHDVFVFENDDSFVEGSMRSRHDSVPATTAPPLRQLSNGMSPANTPEKLSVRDLSLEQSMLQATIASRALGAGPSVWWPFGSARVAHAIGPIAEHTEMDAPVPLPPPTADLRNAPAIAQRSGLSSRSRPLTAGPPVHSRDHRILY